MARLEEKIKDFFLNCKHLSKQISKFVRNRMHYTSCMNGCEDSLGIFRVCRNDEKALECYAQLDGKDVRKIKVKNKVYALCPVAPKFHDEKDYERYKA